ncbi:DUF1501 domain-containing protein [soil metagenome]
MFADRRLTRRAFLSQSACGFGSLALASLLHREAHAGTHHAAKAKAVIFLYMDGGVSQVDSFDPKPLLNKYHGQDPRKAIGKLEPTQFANIGTVMQSPWKFEKRGQSGIEVSDLFPHMAKHVDDFAVIRSMTSKFSEHTTANYFLHTGSGLQGRPSWGAWCGYGLGSGNADLPSFLVLNGGLVPPGGLDNFNSGFLPAAFQGSVFRPGKEPIANIVPLEKGDKQRSKLDLIRKLDDANAARKDDAIDTAIRNYEIAYRMQTAIPDLLSLEKETAATKTLYGVDHKNPGTAIFGAQCLLARRLVERGAKFIELTCPNLGAGIDRWDQHQNLLGGHSKNALAVDQPIGALLEDLKRTGLLKDTLVVWAGEFGRTPFAQGGDGRDHNPFGYSVWLAGGGAKGGVIHGATDDFGYKVVKDRVEMHDLHATMLHLLGIDHKKLTFRFGGRDMRLTDVHGELVTPILA